MDTNRYVGVRSSMVDGIVTTFVEFIVDNEEAMWAEIERVMEDKQVALAITPSLEIHAPLHCWSGGVNQVHGPSPKDDS
jgi:hypothetical protein